MKPALTPLALVVLATRAVPAFAGIADSPLPLLQTGAGTQLLFSVPGVISGGYQASFFVCTSTDTAPQQVGVEVFYGSGGAPCNDAAMESVTVQPGATVKFSTGSVNSLILGGVVSDSVILCGGFGTGSARILSTSKKLVCTAFVGDRINDPPQTPSYQLTVIAKLKQKAAN